MLVWNCLRSKAHTCVSAKSRALGRPRCPSGSGLTIPVRFHVERNRYTERIGIPVRCDMVFASRQPVTCMYTRTPRRSSENATPLVMGVRAVGERFGSRRRRPWSWLSSKIVVPLSFRAWVNPRTAFACIVFASAPFARYSPSSSASTCKFSTLIPYNV